MPCTESRKKEGRKIIARQENFAVDGAGWTAGWLLLCCAMVFIMVSIGGATRLTGSGLSMVEWKPFTGWLPPLNEVAWQVLFDKYRQFPEYQKINAGMELGEFKSIFWLEYIHRVWGRLIGSAFAIPFLFLLLRRAIPRPLVPHLLALLSLGGAQGLLGWFMVQSGLIDHPDEVGGWPTLAPGEPPADADRDGLPDDWESERGLDPDDASDAWADRDGDGWSNLEEFLACA